MHKKSLILALGFGTMRSVRTKVVQQQASGGSSDLSPPPSSFGVDLRGSLSRVFFACAGLGRVLPSPLTRCFDFEYNLRLSVISTP